MTGIDINLLRLLRSLLSFYNQLFVFILIFLHLVDERKR